MELLVTVSQEEYTEETVDPETEVEKVAVALTPKPPHRTPAQLSPK